MKRTRHVVFTFVLLVSFCYSQAQQWSEARAQSWYSGQPWLIGSNYVPASADNQLEMWQEDTFNPAEIDKELGWAEEIGMNTMRVFLHDLLWEQDSEGFARRIDKFLEIANAHHIRPVFVLFDSCWDPSPKLGPQRPPTNGVHNSAWVQSPGASALADPAQHPRLRAYVTGVIGRFGQDPRVLAWDVWNEPDNTNDSAYGAAEPKNKVRIVRELLPQVFEWARSASPSQPLTSGVWHGNWSKSRKLNAVERIQLENSDVISFHSYSTPKEFQRRVKWLRRYRRPLLCTEYMARTVGSTFENILPVAKREGVGAINWGFVQGRTQTNLPWDSWSKPYVDRVPPEWFHDVLYPDGKPYKESETKFIRALTQTQVQPPSKPGN